MPSLTITCPKCQTQLSLAGPASSAGKVKCGKCGATLTVAPPAGSAAQAVQSRPAAVAPPPLPKRAPARVDEPRAPVSARRTRPAPAEKTGPSFAAVAAFCGGGLLLLVAAAVVVVLVMNRGSDTPVAAVPVVQQAVAPAPGAPFEVVSTVPGQAPAVNEKPPVVAPAPAAAPAVPAPAAPTVSVPPAPAPRLEPAPTTPAPAPVQPAPAPTVPVQPAPPVEPAPAVSVKPAPPVEPAPTVPTPPAATAPVQPAPAYPLDPAPKPPAKPAPAAPVEPAPAYPLDPAPATPVNPAPANPGQPAPSAVDTGGGIALNTLDALKRSSVFVKVEAGDMLATGSGFLARVEGNTAFVVTNHHVIAPPPTRIIILHRPGTPRRPGRILKIELSDKPRYSLVFNSGTPEERTYPAEVAADDAKADLAVLRIPYLPPGASPIAIDAELPLVETMPIFIFGFPFGEALATSKRGPAITIGRGSISSIRRNDRGEVSVVQLNGDLNPGNSGGPVVDGQGRLVGIAVATVKGTQIGLAIPVAKLASLVTTAPLAGSVAVRPSQAPPLTKLGPPGGGSDPAFPQQPGLMESPPMSEAELQQILHVLSSKNLPLTSAALLRLAQVQPQDAQRDRVVNALQPLTTVSQYGLDVSAARALGVWANRDTVPVLLDTLSSKTAAVRHESMRVLGLLRDERAADQLARRLGIASDRLVASKALQQLGGPAEKTVIAYLKDSDLFVRSEACKVLEVIGTKESVAPLNAALKDSNSRVRAAAQSALTAVQARKT